MTGRLRVLHVLEAVEGGCARHVRDLVTHAAEIDHVVVVPAERHGGLTDTEVVDEMRRSGADVRIVDMRRSVMSWHNVAAVAAVRRIAREVQPDVIHGHTSIGGVVARLVARMRGVPAVWTPNGVLTGRFPVAVERALARWTARTIAVSPSEAALIGELRLAKPSRLAMVPNGLAAQEGGADVDVRAAAGLPPDATVVGCVARLAHQKGIDTLIATAPIVHAARPDAWVVLIGSGPLDQMVRDARSTPGFVWLEGFNGARAVLPQFTVFTMLSRYEGAPYALMEAMAAGCGCVVTDVVGIRDLVADGESAVIVPTEDPQSAAAAILSLLDDPVRREQLGVAAAARISAEFSARRMSERTLAVYRSVVAASPPLGS